MALQSGLLWHVGTLKASVSYAFDFALAATLPAQAEALLIPCGASLSDILWMQY